MKILFIGGNGNISWHCTKEALGRGHDVYVLNREATLKSRRELPDNVNKLTGDIRNYNAMKQLLFQREFDVVCDFICFDGEQARQSIELFEGKTKQYIVISSEAIYERQAKNLPFKESSPRYNEKTACSYICGKMEVEKNFIAAYDERRFPVTIVRPGYTYDTILPISMGQNCFTPLARYLQGKPVLIAGEGNNLWTFTHSSDFARAFIGLVGNKKAIGEDFHITTDQWMTWNEVTDVLLETVGIKDACILHIPFNEVLQTPLAAQKDMMFQKMWHNIYDNSKIRRFLPEWEAKIDFVDGIRQTIEWLYENDAHRRFNSELDNILEEITLKYCRRN